MPDFAFTCTALGRRLPSIDILDNYLLHCCLISPIPSMVHMKIYTVNLPLHQKCFINFLCEYCIYGPIDC